MRQIGKLIDAKNQHIKSIRLKPDFAEGHNNLGVALKELGLADQAMKSYETAIELNASYRGVQQYGVVLQELARFEEEARAFLEKQKN